MTSQTLDGVTPVTEYVTQSTQTSVSSGTHAPVVQVVQIPHVRDFQLQIIEKIVEIPKFRLLKAPKLLRVWRTAPVCQMKLPEPVQVVGLGPPLSAESPPVFMTAPIVDAPSVVVESTVEVRRSCSAGSNCFRENR